MNVKAGYFKTQKTAHCRVNVMAHLSFLAPFEWDKFSSWLNVFFTTLSKKQTKTIQELNIAFISAKMMRETNCNYRDKNQATNVLSFYYSTENMGEILICPAKVRQELEDWPNQTLEQHYFHLLLHAFLHLLGFTHENVLDKEAMQSIECTLIKNMNFPNPYVV